jgi:hypothetical protein
VDDGLQGRRAGTDGGRLAGRYIASQLEGLGIEGGAPDGAYAQPIELHAVTPEITLVLGDPGQTLTVGPDDPGLVAWPARATETVTVDGPLVFAGFGISAPEYEWDDFGDAPLTDRVLVVLAGDPGLVDTTRFRGRRGTVHGSLARKVQEAARRGARGILVVHDTALTGASWQRTRAAWGREVLLDPLEQVSRELEFVGWVSSDRLAELIGAFGRDLSVLRNRALQPSFRPIPLGAHAVARLRSAVRSAEAEGILGVVRGADRSVASEVVVVAAHYDHLGAAASGDDSLADDSGDNAAGVAVLLGAAAMVHGSAEPPRRTIIFAAPTATEGVFSIGGLAPRQVPVDAGRIVAVINVERPSLADGVPIVAAADAGDAGLLGALEAAAQLEGVELTRWSGRWPGAAELAHIPFASLGVPGMTLLGGAGPDGAYDIDRLLQPNDGVETGAAHSGLRAQAFLVARVARMIANAEDVAAWSPDSPYRAAWERLERRRGRLPER